MHIKSLKLENFGSYEQAELQLSGLGLVLLDGENRDTGGSNGAGKSTLLNAICWGLFGKTPGGKVSTDVRRLGQSSARVTVELEVGGWEVKVQRTRANSNSLQFWIDGKDSRQAGLTETQALLTQTLEMDYATFLSVVLFPQGGSGLAALGDKEQKHVLSQVLNLGRFVEASEKVSEWIKEDAEQEESLKRETRTLDTQLDQVQAQAEALKLKEVEFQEAHQDKLHELTLLIQNHTKARPPDPSYAYRDSLLVEYSESRQEDALNLHEQAVFKRNELFQQQARNSALASSLQGQIVQPVDPEAQVALHDSCPACQQTLPNLALEALKNTFKEQQQAQLARNNQLLDQIQKINKEDHETNTHLSVCDTAIAKFTEVVENSQRLERAIATANSEIEQLEAQQRHWTMGLSNLNSDLKEQQEVVSPYTQLIEDSKAQAEKIKQAILTTKAKLKPFQHNLSMLRFWKDAFGNKGVKSLLLSTVTPYLNERANVYIRELTNDQASIQISTQTKLKSGEYRDQLSFEVDYPHTGSHYATKSGGERRRADIAIQFAMADLAATRTRNPVWLALLDEIFDNLDAQGAEAVVNLLNTHIVPTRGTVLVLSHSNTLKPLFENRITVVKQGGISRLVF